MGTIEVYNQKQFVPRHKGVNTINSSVNKLNTNIPCHGEEELMGKVQVYEKEEVAHLRPQEESPCRQP